MTPQVDPGKSTLLVPCIIARLCISGFACFSMYSSFMFLYLLPCCICSAHALCIRASCGSCLSCTFLSCASEGQVLAVEPLFLTLSQGLRCPHTSGAFSLSILFDGRAAGPYISLHSSLSFSVSLLPMHLHFHVYCMSACMLIRRCRSWVYMYYAFLGALQLALCYLHFLS